MRKIAVLGATGSIGTQTLDIVSRYPEEYKAVCLTAHSSSEKLFELARRFKPNVCALNIEPEGIPDDLKNIEWFFGSGSSVKALEASKADDTLNAIVGIAGLDATVTAVNCCERILLANKEALITGGNLVMKLVSDKQKKLLPVDSEHSAIFQCLQAANGNRASRLILTASGGALRSFTKEQTAKATVDDVLKHPTWNMGRKITVDCATMLNKGLEVIEAHYLFDMPVDKIDVVIHPQSVIHSMVEFEDGAILAQLGCPDMRGPIGYAMGYPKRVSYDAKRLDFAALGQLTFEKPDLDKYRCLKLSIQAITTGGTAPVILNGANEEAVARFLSKEIGFNAIADTVEYALDKCEIHKVNTIEDVHAADAYARRVAKEYLDKNA